MLNEYRANFALKESRPLISQRNNLKEQVEASENRGGDCGASHDELHGGGGKCEGSWWALASQRTLGLNRLDGHCEFMVTVADKLSYNLLPAATNKCPAMALIRVLGEIKVVVLPLACYLAAYSGKDGLFSDLFA